MTNLLSLRFIARLWFLVALFSALLLGALTLEAQAQNQPRPQTDVGGVKPPGDQSPGTIIEQSVATRGQITIDASAQVRDRETREGGPWIHGRQVDVENLEDGLVISESHTVIIESANGDGRNGVFAEYLRQNPQDSGFTLNADYFVNLNEGDTATRLKEELSRLSNLAESRTGKVIIHIPDIKLFMKGAIMSPIDAIWDRVGANRNRNLYFVLGSTPGVTEEAIKRAKIPEIKTGIVRQTVLPGSLEAVTAHAFRVAEELHRQRGVQISTEAIETAARLAVRKLGESSNLNLNSTGVFKRVENLLNQSASTLLRLQRSGQTLASETSAQVRRLEAMERSLKADLAAEPNNEDLKKRLQEVAQKLATEKLKSANATTPNTLSQDLAEVELKLAQAKIVIEQEETKRSRITGRTSAHKEAEADVIRLSATKKRLEDEIAMATDTSNQPAKRVGKTLVLQIAAAWLNTTVASLENNFETGLRNIGNIKNNVFGQDHVIDAIRGRLLLRASNLQEGQPIRSQQQADEIKAGVKDDFTRPLASFWFAGDTGVGKTETAFQLANELGYSYHRFDMSEFMEKHYAAGLIGSPAGYVGYGEDGKLIQALDRNPESVIVFDEIEKAHPDIQNILLQLLEYGEVTAADGKKKGNGKRAIIIMTSNLAKKIAGWERGQLVEFLSRQGDGAPGWSMEEIRNKTQMDPLKLRSEVYKLYVTNATLMQAEGLTPMKPEIVGRMDEVMMFNRLDEATVVKIAQKSLRDMAVRLKYFHKISMRMTPKAVAAVAGLFTSSEGARSMRRGIDRMLRMPIAEQIIGQVQANERLLPGDSVVIDVDERGQFQQKVNTEAELTTSLAGERSNPAADEMRARIDARKRPAFAQTMELVRRVMSPELLIPEHAFSRFRRR